MCQFVDNHSPQGGAIWVGDEGSSLILNNSMVYNNSAEQGGGGMYIKHGSATIAGTTFSNNSAPEDRTSCHWTPKSQSSLIQH